jgi:glutathione synthase/RimK-type ligase-like ATP-grasp enzyme
MQHLKRPQVLRVKSPASAVAAAASDAPLMGLAALLRLNFSGADLAVLGRALLSRCQADATDAAALMDASVLLQFKGEMDLAMTMQREALQMRQHFCLPAVGKPRLRVLALMAPGDLMANVPLECLLENSDAELHLYYLLPEGEGTDPIPAHDVVFVALSETENNARQLDSLGRRLAEWPHPVVNRPEHIRRVARDRASELLNDIPGIAMPPTLRIGRSALAAIAGDGTSQAALPPAIRFPLIVRPLDSHAGHDLHKVDDAAALDEYLHAVEGDEFFVSPFIDYRSGDGFFRKFRVALIDGRPYACHMGISSHWMIHYLNAGMAESPAKRAEEERFMAAFDADFARRHAAALSAIHQRMDLEYVCIDCAEMPDGRLLVFEIDHAMVVHALDPVDVFPYKQPQMRKVFEAFRDMLARRAGLAR